MFARLEFLRDSSAFAVEVALAPSVWESVRPAYCVAFRPCVFKRAANVAHELFGSYMSHHCRISASFNMTVALSRIPLLESASCSSRWLRLLLRRTPDTKPAFTLFYFLSCLIYIDNIICTISFISIIIRKCGFSIYDCRIISLVVIESNEW